jgi:hypothetical protein
MYVLLVASVPAVGVATFIILLLMASKTPALFWPSLVATSSSVSWAIKKFWLAERSRSASVKTEPSWKSTNLVSTGVFLSIFTTAVFAGIELV